MLSLYNKIFMFSNENINVLLCVFISGKSNHFFLHIIKPLDSMMFFLAKLNVIFFLWSIEKYERKQSQHKSYLFYQKTCQNKFQST